MKGTTGSTGSLTTALQHLVEGHDLSTETMTACMRQMMAGEASPVQMAAFLMGLRAKGESITEITAAAAVMREFATPVQLELPFLVDMCGTGGDGAHTFNISTAAMFVVAAAGAAVAKHGGRSVSSKSGSADLLEHLGVAIGLSAQDTAQCLKGCGVGFMFAPNHHAAMKHIAPIRKELGLRTVFNVLGPLTNPAGAPCQLMGVYQSSLVPVQAEVLKRLGSDHVLVVHAEEGLDELHLVGKTHVAELKDGKVHPYTVTAQQFGFPSYSSKEVAEAIRAESLEESASRLASALANEPGPARDIVAFNAAGGLLASNKASDWPQAIDMAMAALASGAARNKLDAFRALSQSLSSAAAQAAGH
jgi:anthranilate phosphoribosyltransferase